MGAICTTPQFSDMKTLPLTADALENVDIIARSATYSGREPSFSGRLQGPAHVVCSDKSNATSSGKTANNTTANNSPGKEESKTASRMFQSLVNPNHFSVNSLISKRIWDGQKICMKDPMVRHVFTKYVMNMTWIEKVSIQLLDQAIKRRRTQDTQEVTFNDYAMYPRSRSGSHDSNDIEVSTATVRRCTQLKIKDSMESDTFRRKAFIETCFSPDQIKSILLASLWPLFLESPEYSEIETGQEAVVYEEDTNLGVSDRMSLKEHDSEKTRRVKDIYYQTAKRMSEEDIMTMLKAGNWIQTVLTCLEDINLSVSVSSTQPGFPLIFVNKSFENMTLYRRSEVLGKKCNVLQCQRTEPEQIAKLGDALAKGEGVKVAIMNARKNGAEFCNFLALRPVYDYNGKYNMVLAVQYDITKEEASLKEIKMVEDFLSIICNVFKG